MTVSDGSDLLTTKEVYRVTLVVEFRDARDMLTNSGELMDAAIGYGELLMTDVEKVQRPLTQDELR